MSKYYIIKDPIPNIPKMIKNLIITKKTPLIPSKITYCTKESNKIFKQSKLEDYSIFYYRY